TARIQTVDRSTNPRFYGVIEKFAELTGLPVILNTSFNLQRADRAKPRECDLVLFAHANGCAGAGRFLRHGSDVIPAINPSRLLFAISRPCALLIRCRLLDP